MGGTLSSQILTYRDNINPDLPLWRAGGGGLFVVHNVISYSQTPFGLY